MDDQLEANKNVIRDWHALALDQNNPEEAAAKHLGPYYRQHNPGAADGAEAYVAFMKWLKQTYPDFHVDTKRIIAEGDYVVLHSHSTRQPGDRGMAVVDIFRLENGKIVEHWDVVQEVPEKSANNNTMF
jgi:predicted SnoaL-like aldol condensation-catalyzing enzyme